MKALLAVLTIAAGLGSVFATEQKADQVATTEATTEAHTDTATPAPAAEEQKPAN